MSDEQTAMFLPEGDRLVPTRLAQGPWDPTTLHGGPVSGLLARAIESAAPTVPMRVARLTIDLLRPVPMAALTVEHDVVRSGRQIQVVDSRLRHDGKLVARASGLFVRCDRTVANSAAKNLVASGPMPVGHETEVENEFGAFRDRELPGFVDAIEVRRVVGALRQGTPAVGWARLRKPLIAGEVTTPLQRLATLGDFVSGFANYLDFADVVTPNADLTYHLARHPEGEWLGLDCATVITDDGLAQSSARLFDTEQFIGTALASLVVSPRA